MQGYLGTGLHFSPNSHNATDPVPKRNLGPSGTSTVQNYHLLFMALTRNKSQTPHRYEHDRNSLDPLIELLHRALLMIYACQTRLVEITEITTWKEEEGRISHHPVRNVHHPRPDHTHGQSLNRA